MSRLFFIAMWCLIVPGLAVMLFLGVSSAVFSPWVGALSVLFSALYIAVVLALLRLLGPAFPGARQQAHGRDSGWVSVGWIIAALTWGAGASLLFVFPSAMAVMQLNDYTGWDEALASWSGAYPEEAAKALGVVFVLFSFRMLNRPWHGAVVGAVVGLGFETFENILYGATGGVMSLTSDFQGMLGTWISRIFVGPFLHISFTAIAGWGIGWAIYAAHKSIIWRIVTALSWLALAFILHFGWNYMMGSLTGFAVKNIVICIVMYTAVAYICRRSFVLAREDESYSYQPRLDAAFNPPSLEQ